MKACLELRKRKEKIKAIKGFQPLGEESFETGAKSVGGGAGRIGTVCYVSEKAGCFHVARSKHTEINPGSIPICRVTYAACIVHFVV